MTSQNIESELSYAYLHAVAAKAGISCKQGDRHDDCAGVDAELTYRGKLKHPYLTHIQLKVQLKASIQSAGNDSEYLSYFIQGKERYNKLRVLDSKIHKILIVLFLPDNPDEWLNSNVETLIMKKSAYWVSLQNAPETDNNSGVTIYIPKSNLLTPNELLRIVDLSVNEALPSYQIPVKK